MVASRSRALHFRTRSIADQSHILRLAAKQQGARTSPTNFDIALFLGPELPKMMIRMTVTESAPFRCRQGAKQRMVS